MLKRWKFIEHDAESVAKLHEVLPIHPIFCQLLVQRGIRSYEEAQRFFRPKLSDLYDPFWMKDMDKAVRRLEKALIRKEKVLIYGDYDVDGTTAVALMMAFLGKYHTQLDYYIPDRYKEGYGISLDGVEYAAQNRYTLVIALDCGITAQEKVKIAKEKGIDFIICDHHLPEETLPEAVAVLNPKRLDCPYPYKELSGCAIGFKFMQAFAQHNDIPFEEVEALLDLVAVSLACDIVDLTDENRVLAHFGLIRLNENPRLGLEAIKSMTTREGNYTIRDVVFGIGPLINAAGRIEHAKEAVKMLLAKEKTMAYNYAQNLIEKNQARRDLESQIVQEAHALIAQDTEFANKKSCVLFQPHWHKGVIGIVASKMVDVHYRPTIVLTESDGKLVGSARSIDTGFDMHHALYLCKDLLISFGGHIHAAGLSLLPENLPAFLEKFEQIVAEQLPAEAFKPTVLIDSELELKDIDPKFWNILKQFAPFGPGNMRPVFYSKLVRDIGYSKLLKDNHVKLVVRQGESEAMDGIAFGFGEHFEQIHARKPFHFCYVIDENEYQGTKKLQLQAKDIRF